MSDSVHNGNPGECGRNSFPVVLIVDDEPSVVAALVRELRKEPYQVLTAGGGEEGLALLQTRPVSVIVADMQMPKMNGVEFLEQAAKFCPDSVNMILSGHSDANLVMAAINSGTVWRYLTKPWQEDDLKVAIRNALEMYQLDEQRRALLEELQVKNAELAAWSGRLEATVREQTRELRNQGVLLRMILDGRGSGDLTRQLCEDVGALFCTGRVFLYLTHGDSWLQGTGEVLSLPPVAADVWGRAQTEAISRRGWLQEGTSVYCPLLDEEEYHGMIVALEAQPVPQTGADRTGEYLEGYATIAAVALRQQRLGQESGALIDRIDHLLGELR